MRTPIRIALLLALMAGAVITSMDAVSADERGLPATRLFQVIVIEAVTSGEVSAENIPPSAMKALDDMRDFLPYKGYRFLDSALVRTADRASTSLRGPGGARYRVDLAVMESDEENEPDLFFRRFSIHQMSGSEEQPEATGTGETPRAPEAPKELISSSFGMDVGETVIVGSSRLNGDGRALILLVTALP